MKPMHRNLLLPLVAVVTSVTFLLMLEGGARLVIFWMYGRQDHAMWWRLEYEPYLLFKWNNAMYAKWPPKTEPYRILVLGGSAAGLMPNRLLQAAFVEMFQQRVEVADLAHGGDAGCQN